MKKNIIVLGTLLSAVMMITGCASKCTTCEAPLASSAPAAHDYKGEMASKK